MLIIAYLILGLVYFSSPKHVKVAACVINFFIPDSIPFIDAVVMIVALLA